MAAAVHGEQRIGPAALNRALLARQELLERGTAPVLATVEHLLGLQAQAVVPPYLGLWSRLEGFDPGELGRLLLDREVVRLALQRGTVHLVSVRDACFLRPLVQEVIERSHQGAFGRRMGGAEPAALAAAAREELAAEPLGARELGRRLVARGIGTDPEAIGNGARAHLPLVQVTPRGVWGRSGAARYATLEAWTGRALDPAPSREQLVLRYLRAFGPASVMDAQAWSGLTRLRATFDALRPRLVALHGEDGAELWDVPEGPRPDPGVPAPVRFLGEYDNVLLGHADRGRIIPAGFPWTAMLESGRFVHNLLVGGMLRATWFLDRTGRGPATVEVRPFPALDPTEREAVAAEALRVARFLAPDAPAHDVRFAAVEG